MIAGRNESKRLTKHLSCKCKPKFDRRECNSDQWWNNDKYRCECKKRHVCEKDYICNSANVVMKMECIYKVLWMIQQSQSCKTKKQKQLQQILIKKCNL